MRNETEFGYFGNLWVTQRWLEKTGDVFDNHKHYFDHMTMLVKGRILVEVEGHQPKEFVGPTFITIKKEYSHKFTALEDDIVFYCVFALREDEAGVDEIYQSGNSPYGNCPDDYWDKKQIIERNVDVKEDNGTI